MASPSALLEPLLRVRERLASAVAPAERQEELPLRAELFGADQMEQHGKALAAAHRLTDARTPDRLLPRLAENESIIVGACDLLTATLKDNRRISPAGEWLLDNLYLIEDQIRTAHRHLPKTYSRELPRLGRGPSTGLPRVYDIALETIAHGDGRVDVESLSRFVAAYQSTSPLKLGELWAIPIMLRLALIENLRRVAARVASGTIDRGLAEVWADQMMEVAEKDPTNLILVVADMARSNPPLVSAFVAEMARRLHGQTPAVALSLTWIEHRLSELNLSIEQMVQAETRKQAADQVTVGNSIGSLRLLGALDWREFVETMSVVDHKLREDPADVYARMDFTTRDRYRHVVERIAKWTKQSELDVARKAVQLSAERRSRAEGDGADGDVRTRHVGYYLVDRGRPELERAVHARLPLLQQIRRFGHFHPLGLYLGCIGGLTLALTLLLCWQAVHEGHDGWGIALFVVASLFATSQLAVALVNWGVTLVASPRPLPRMDFQRGIPSEFRTLVVVPSMLSSADDVDALIAALEVRFLANRDTNLHFALLTDFPDAPQEHMPGDDALVARASDGIRALNEKYPHEGATDDDTFYLFHRPRRWNPEERVWMGYERKRGKLEDLNALLRGGPADRFSAIVGDITELSSVRFVITLDTDTQLPREAARQLVGAMAHPLNRPRYDERARRVVSGYGILQPRMAITLAGASRSLYSRLAASEPGIDPYTRVVSDAYQDLFAEGSFVGKGIYDVDAFRRALEGRLPENRILSHDLIEGCFARSGLLSDVQLYEDTPSRYSADVSRRHRWIRGDYQIAQWALPRLLVRVAGTRRNPLSGLARWKIGDNLRRGIVPIALLALLVAGWTLSPLPWLWTCVVLGVLFVPPLAVTLLDLARKRPDATFAQHAAVALRSGVVHFAHAGLLLATLPYEAWFTFDAIARTAWRMLVSRRHLLEWNPSRNAEREAERRDNLFAAYRRMWVAPAIGLALLVAERFGWLDRAHLAAAIPFLVLWATAPGIVWLLGRPLVAREPQLSREATAMLHRLARKTWLFFETFVGPEDHWLPPDNFQEQPVVAVAHRTSPTNMGISLLANLAAHDFGFITGGELVERTKNAVATMLTMERYEGHFYNWYDTLSLQPLHPHYVSSVDSGNLAGHLLTLGPGLASLPSQPLLGLQWFEGLMTTVQLLMDAEGGPDPSRIAPFRRDLESAYDTHAQSLDEVWSWLAKLAGSAEALDTDAVATAEALPDTDGRLWTRALVRQCRAAQGELALLAPWLLLPPPPSASLRLPLLAAMPTLADVAAFGKTAVPAIDERLAAHAAGDDAAWLQSLREAVATGSRNAEQRIGEIAELVRHTRALAEIDYGFLYDRGRHLLAIGYNVSERRLDASFYDLLASEARLASFVAIAQGQLPQDNWFSLGRLLTRTATSAQALLSWSGSMFEYLMPLLVMPTFRNTLLDETYRASVARQIAYGGKRGVPWGISESGYNTVDTAMNYQYRAFGVPGLGLKRGLAEDLVIAPYATVMALMVAPVEATRNIERMTQAGFEGRYGLYEAVDFTPARVPRGQPHAIVRSFMAHHQGMNLLALAYRLLGQPMQKRFASDPQFKATMPLLHERIPQAGSYFQPPAMLSDVHAAAANGPEMPVRHLTTADTPIPEVQLLSNGRYHVMVSNAGGGYSRWKDLAVTRWREDGTCDGWGTFCYIRDLASGEYWSYARQPTAKAPATYDAIFSEARVEFRRRDEVEGGEFETHADIVVSPEDDIELRRIKIVNRSRVRKTIDVTSYAEVVLAPAAADDAHPAFSKLFVQTEIVARRNGILCTRRPRAKNEQPPWMIHQMVAHGVEGATVSYQTDRARFIGRGRTVAAPLALDEPGALTGQEGSVLDPVVAIRIRLQLDPDQSATIDVVTGIGETRDAALNLAGKYHDRHLADRVFDLAWTHSIVSLRHINASESEAQLYGRLASSVIYANPALRAAAGVLVRNRRGQSGLWSYAISGDLPIVLLQIGDAENMDIVRQLIRAHAYWRLKGLSVDLVIWNEDRAGYRQQLQDQIMGLIAAGAEAHFMDRPGGIFVRRAEQIADEDRVLLQSVARAIITDRRGDLADQVSRRPGGAEARALQLNMLRLKAPRARTEAEPVPASAPPPDLQFFNGLGGFSTDGREYVIHLAPGATTPAPWSNVLANDQFGSVLSESGSAYTWLENAHEFRITPWVNDPVTDACGEAFYVRDDETGRYWSPTPLPVRGATAYTIRHGFGYSVFEHSEESLATELSIYVDVEAPVKYAVLKVRNDSDRPRKVTVCCYVEWALGDQRGSPQMHVATEIDAGSGALSARNAYNTEFAGRIAFLDVDEVTRTQGVTVTGDRVEFIGRNGSLRRPAAMRRAQLSNRVGAALDPCGAIQVSFELAAGFERELVFRLGAGRNAEEAGKLMHRFRGSAAARSALENVRAFWRHTLGAVQVETPEPALNVLANGWLVYQVLACRFWARSGYYQSGGAYGFRDQLQDLMALIHTQPLLLRGHLLTSASRQFREGDVQHWWHPPQGRGVRTNCSDDYLWLPLATARYVTATGDTGVLTEQMPYLEGRPVPPGEDSYFDLPGRSETRARLYEHCVAALRHGLRYGAHGLPLMGSGDWNDGMNLVGIQGKGESVWLAFFLIDVLNRFIPVARLMNDRETIELCQVEAGNLKRKIEANAWDGNWYRRAYFDDGMPLGSVTNAECQIDSLSQSWAVLSGAGDPGRARGAMDAVDARLVRRDEKLVQLLTPAFDHAGLDPGYIQGYVPGVRENGGQYTHAAVWTAMAFAALGDARRAFELAMMISPLLHGATPEEIAKYKVEPYVVAADVYALPPHTGRGGWSWYTGSAGWMYRLLVESLLGLTLDVDRLRFAPCVPDAWTSFRIDYRYRETLHRITVVHVDASEGRLRVVQDGVTRDDDTVQLFDDRNEHTAEVRIPRRPQPAVREPAPVAGELA